MHSTQTFQNAHAIRTKKKTKHGLRVFKKRRVDHECWFFRSLCSVTENRIKRLFSGLECFFHFFFFELSLYFPRICVIQTRHGVQRLEHIQYVLANARRLLTSKFDYKFITTVNIILIGTAFSVTTTERCFFVFSSCTFVAPFKLYELPDEAQKSGTQNVTVK